MYPELLRALLTVSPPRKEKRKSRKLELGKWVNFNRVLGEPKNEGKVLTVRAKSPILRPRRLLDITPKSTVAKRKSVIIKPAEEANKPLV